MEATIFKFAFFLLIGLAVLGLLATTITVLVLEVKVLWLWLRTRVRTAKAGQA
jgi:hypothetical protein